MFRSMRSICFVFILVSLVFLPAPMAVQEVTASAPAQVSANLLPPADPFLPTPHPILSDLRVRQAIAYCTDKTALVAAAYPEITDPVQRQALVTDSFLPKDHWGYQSPTQKYPYNPALGRQLLDQAGWTLAVGAAFRNNASGSLLAIPVYSTTSSFRQQYLAVFEEQMAACGIMVLRSHFDPGWLFNEKGGLQHRDFEVSIYAWVDDPDPTQGLPDVYGCATIPSRENNWVGKNYMGWCNTQVDAALKQAANTQLTQQQRAAALHTAQEAFASDLPSLPLFRRPDAPTTWEHVDFNLQVVPPTIRPLSDHRVREAVAYCTDKVALAKAGFPLITDDEANQLIVDSFIHKTHWAYNPQVTRYAFNPAAGRQLLDDAGWKFATGASYRTNPNGEELAIKFTTTTAAFRQAWAAAFESQMAACGIRLLRQHVPGIYWFADRNGLQVRNFEMGAFAWVGEPDPGGQILWDCAQIPSAANQWKGQNYMGWCNERATRAIRKATNEIGRSQRIIDYGIVQAEYTKDVPAIPLFTRSDIISTAADLQGVLPTTGEEYYTYNAGSWLRPGRDTIILGMTQEPATMFTLTSPSVVANLVRYLVRPNAYTSLNFDLQPNWMKQLSTLENGLAQNLTVTVKEGDEVQNTSGDVVPLAPGTAIIDADGNEVVFQSGTVNMKRMIVQYQGRDNLKWQNGSPVTQADFELGYKIACDPLSGAASYDFCERTQAIQFNGLSYTVTWVPGYQNPLYSLAPYEFYPSQQPVLSTGPYQGKTLAQVPANAWAALPEVSDTPWSFGPYMVKEWVKGDRIVLQANPYYFKGLPKTPNLMIKFIGYDEVEPELIAGNVDIVGWDSLPGLTAALVEAEQTGKLKNYVVPSATWEHIDFHLDPLPVASSVTPNAPAVIQYSDPQGDPVTVSIPAGAVQTAVDLIFDPQPVSSQPLPDNLLPAGQNFTLTAYKDHLPLANFVLIKPLTLSFTYRASDIPGLGENTLTLFYWNGAKWADAASTCTGANYLLKRDPAKNMITVNICHLTDFSLMGEERANLYLPLLKR